MVLLEAWISVVRPGGQIIRSRRTGEKSLHEPAAMIEAAAAVLVRPARSLHYSVYGKKRGYQDFAHDLSPVISASFRTVRQLRIVLVVSSFASKYALVSLVRAAPLGQRR